MEQNSVQLSLELWVMRQHWLYYTYENMKNPFNPLPMRLLD